MDFKPGEVLESSLPAPTAVRIRKREMREPNIDIKRDPRHLIKVLTYNIWHKEEYWQERIQHVVKLVKDTSPDVCCLLEVSQNCYHYVAKTLDPFYIVFQVFIEEGDTAGMVLLCRREAVELPEGSQPYYYDYSSGEGRVIGVELVLLSNGEHIHVLCTKLDDHRDNDHIRSDQFGMVQHVIKGIKNCILVGDFNVFGDKEEIDSKIMQSKLNDSWIKMGCPNKIKYTFDGKRNHITRDRTQLRASRVYYSGSHLSIRSMGFIGTGHISPDVPISPSCHYGLTAVFQCS
jgi:endonuclease/exonuclease/phosphatase family metal-dependent hydrolase